MVWCSCHEMGKSVWLLIGATFCKRVAFMCTCCNMYVCTCSSYFCSDLECLSDVLIGLNDSPPSRNRLVSSLALSLSPSHSLSALIKHWTGDTQCLLLFSQLASLVYETGQLVYKVRWIWLWVYKYMCCVYACYTFVYASIKM